MVAEALPLPRGRMARRIDRDETVDALLSIRRHAGRVHLAVVADRPDLALHAAGQITSIAERRLRQMHSEGNFDDAA